MLSLVLATVFDSSDAIGVGLVVTILGGTIAVLRAMHQRDKADDARHHELDKRMTIVERQGQIAPLLRTINDTLSRHNEILDRNDRAARSDVYSRKDDRGH